MTRGVFPRTPAGCVVPANTLTPGVAQNAPPGPYVPSALRAVHAGGVFGILPRVRVFCVLGGKRFLTKRAPRRGCEACLFCASAFSSQRYLQQVFARLVEAKLLAVKLSGSPRTTMEPA